MTRYQKSVGGGGEPVEGYPMDFKEYDYDLLDEGVWKGIVLMCKEDRPNVYRAVVGIAHVGGKPCRADDRDARFVQVNVTMKTGTSWFDNFVEVMNEAKILDLEEGGDLDRVDWRAVRGAIVEVDVEGDTYKNRDGETVDTNRVKKFMRARKPNRPGREERNGDGRDRDDRRPSAREEKSRERDRREGPWRGDDDRRGGRERDRDDRPRREEEPRREESRSGDRRDSRDDQPRGGYGKTYGDPPRGDDRPREDDIPF